MIFAKSFANKITSIEKIGQTFIFYFDLEDINEIISGSTS